MINTDNFIKRIEILLDYYTLNASAFADKIGVQRSSLSHLLSGRNKPSLDFILKILEEFPEVDLYWILNGKGSFPQNNEVVPAKEISTPLPVFETIQKQDDLFSEKKSEEIITKIENKKNDSSTFPIPISENEIDKIVIFYKNGTFKSYQPQ